MQFLRKIAWPIAVIYGMVVHIRNWCYDVGIFSTKSYKTPTLCVGNLSVGGTGKTPMIEYLILLLQKDFNIAVLSRGYKRKSKGFLLANSESTVEELGDEPFQLYAKFRNLFLAVDSDRQNGISKLEAMLQPDVILLDDAFQHRKVTPSFNILLTTYEKLYVHDFFLPTGTLRDSKNQARRAQLIVVTKCPSDLKQSEKAKIKKALGVKVPVLFAYFEYAPKVVSSKDILEIPDLTHKGIGLITGIADPMPLVSYLSSLELDFKHLNYPDHYDFSSKDLKKFEKYTTEKDYVRLNGKVANLYFIGVKHEFMDNGKKQLIEMLQKHIKPLSQSWN